MIILLLPDLGMDGLNVSEYFSKYPNKDTHTYSTISDYPDRDTDTFQKYPDMVMDTLKVSMNIQMDTFTQTFFFNNLA